VGTGQVTSLRRALIGFAAVGVVFGVVMAVVVATSDHQTNPGVEAALTLIISWSFIGTGLYSWDRRPDNLTGPLMVAVGFTWLLGQLSASDVPALFAIGVNITGIPFAILIHLLFAFPDGTLKRPFERRCVALAYFLTVVYPWLLAPFVDPAETGDCDGCPNNPLLVWDNQGLYNALVVVQNLLGVAVMAALIWHFVRRARESTDPAERRRNAPVWWAGGVTLLFVIALLLTNLAPEDGTYDDWIYFGAGAALATVPYAFLLGLLRSRLTEAELVAEENTRLDAELRARLVELRESRARIVEAGYAERRRVERDLHDGAQQRLVALALDLRLVRAKLEEEPAAAAELLEGATLELAAATEELRELARGLHPPVLTDRGLVPALEALASRSPIPVSVEADETERAPPSAEAAAYFVASEALTNVVRHAGAQRAVVRVDRSDGRLRVEISDDGRGGAEPTGGSGLRGLSDRVAALDGSLEVESDPGRGTVVRAVIPVAPAALSRSSPPAR
jgi:signal transduction histidine kinase